MLKNLKNAMKWGGLASLGKEGFKELIEDEIFKQEKMFL